MIFKNLYFFVFISAILFAISSCAHFDQNAYNTAFINLKQSAQKYQKDGKYEEVVFITRALLDAEPDNIEINTLQDKAIEARPELSPLVYKSVLGSNLGDRVSNTAFPWVCRIIPLLYITNRVLDYIDIISLEVGPCLGIGYNVHVTEMISLGAQISGGEAMIGLNRRHLSARATVEEFFELLPVGSSYTAEARAYTGGVYGISAGNAGLRWPSDRIYQRARDYWGIGDHGEFLFLAVSAEYHPIELFDFLAGIIFFDPLHDDIGVSRGIKFAFTDNETAAMKQLAYQVRAR